MDFDYYALRTYFGSRHAETVDRFALLRGIAGEISNHLLAQNHSRPYALVELPAK